MLTPACENGYGAPEREPPVCESHPNQVLNSSCGGQRERVAEGEILDPHMVAAGIRGENVPVC